MSSAAMTHTCYTCILTLGLLARIASAMSNVATTLPSFHVMLSEFIATLEVIAYFIAALGYMFSCIATVVDVVLTKL